VDALALAEVTAGSDGSDGTLLGNLALAQCGGRVLLGMLCLNMKASIP
jgi:hypothetical protein